MSVKHHIDDATIMAYAAGNLNEGFTLVLAAHIESCPRCRERVSEALTLGGALLSALAPAPLPRDGLAEVWERIENVPAEDLSTMPPAKQNGIPGVLVPYLSDGLDSVPWRSLVPGIRQHVLDNVECGNGTVRLMAIAPGVTVPHHGHGGTELTLVLRGSYSDEIGRFRGGDLADLDPSVRHQPVADSDEPCICLIATDERLRYSGFFSRMLQPLIGI